MIPKFKAKRIDNGEWVYGCLVYDLKPENEIDTIRQAWIREPLGLLGSMFEVDPKTVGMCTGLTDKNGVEIYAGDYNQDYDVVRWCEKRNGWALALYDIPTKDFIECHCYNCEGHFDIDDDLSNFEIIGNIYELEGE